MIARWAAARGAVPLPPIDHLAAKEHAVPSCVSAEQASVFTVLADLVREGSTTNEVYAALCIAATLTIPGCDHASLMIRRDGTCNTAAVSDAIAGRVDKLGLALRSGPCLDAIESLAAQIESDLTSNSRWPALTSRVLAETPVRGAMSIQMPVDRARVGALNLFSDRPNVFDGKSVARAQVLSAFATVAISAAAHREEALTLRRGLDSNRAIGTAIGMLMAHTNTSEEGAFAMLRQMSQASNVKLAQVAADVIRGHRQRGADKSA